MTTAMAVPPAPVPITILVAFHPVAIIPVAIIVLSGSASECQTADAEDHQQDKSYDFLYEHVSPFRDVNVV